MCKNFARLSVCAQPARAGCNIVGYVCASAKMKNGSQELKIGINTNTAPKSNPATDSNLLSVDLSSSPAKSATVANTNSKYLGVFNCSTNETMEGGPAQPAEVQTTTAQNQGQPGQPQAPAQPAPGQAGLIRGPDGRFISPNGATTNNVAPTDTNTIPTTISDANANPTATPTATPNANPNADPNANLSVNQGNPAADPNSEPVAVVDPSSDAVQSFAERAASLMPNNSSEAKLQIEQETAQSLQMSVDIMKALQAELAESQKSRAEMKQG